MNHDVSFKSIALINSSREIKVIFDWCNKFRAGCQSVPVTWKMFTAR